MTVEFKYLDNDPNCLYERVDEQMEIIGVVYHKLADDGRGGHIAWITSQAQLPEGAQIYIKRSDR
jgi:hypothetical protein